MALKALSVSMQEPSLDRTADPRALDTIRWTREARRGSQRAFAWLYRRHALLVHGILLSRVRPALADELTQDCFAMAFARLSQLQDDASFGPWIATIARRLVPASSSLEVSIDAVVEPMDGNAAPDDRVEAQRMLAAISRLPDAYRETLVLRLVEGLSGAEIAALTGLTPASVRVNLHRGMQKLREHLGLVQSRPKREETP